MRVLYFHQHFSTRQGSVGTRSYEFARALVARGHAVVMVCGSYQIGSTGLEQNTYHLIQRGSIDGIEVIQINLEYSNKDGFLKRSWTFAAYAILSMYLACSERCDVVVATSTPLTAAIPGIAAKLIRRRPFIFEIRDLWPELPIAMGIVKNSLVIGLLRGLEWLGYRCADACIALAPGIAEGIRKRSSSSKSIHLIPNGCDLDLFMPRIDKSARASFAVPIDRVVAVFSGAHGLANGLDALLDAAAALLKLNSSVQLLLIGDGRCKADLQARATREGLSNVTFLDPMPKDTLAKLLPLCDIGLQILANIPQFYTATSPNKFFDYLACGLPVVTNYPGWIATLITENECGVAAPGVALAAALDSLARSPQQRAAMAKNARALAERAFNRSDLAAQFIAVVEQANPPSAEQRTAYPR